MTRDPWVTVVTLADHISLERLFDYCSKRRELYPHCAHVHDGIVLESYNNSRAHDLRFDRKRHMLRDTPNGALARPIGPVPAELCPIQDARDSIMQRVWFRAIFLAKQKGMNQ